MLLPGPADAMMLRFLAKAPCFVLQFCFHENTNERRKEVQGRSTRLTASFGLAETNIHRPGPYYQLDFMRELLVVFAVEAWSKLLS